MAKIMKYIFIICLSSFVLIGCDNKTTTETTTASTTITTILEALEAPTNLVQNTNNISWDAVDNATEYEIHLDDSVFETSNTEYTISTEGSYLVYVVAKAIGWNDSDSSEVLTVELSYEHSVDFNKSLEGNTVSWDSIDNAIGYNVVINGVSHTVTNTTYTITGFDPGYLSITVQAVFPIGVSNFSDPLFYENNLTILDTVNVQYSINSDADIVIWTVDLTSNTIITNSHGERLDLNNVIINSDRYLTLNADYVKSLDLGDNSLFVIIGPNKTEVIINLTDKTVPYIISSTGIYTDGTEDISFQLELFDGSLYSVNGAAEDTVLYEMNGNVLTIQSEFIADKFLSTDTFVLSFVISKDDLSVVGYMFFHKE
jgi:hypothetical protein